MSRQLMGRFFYLAAIGALIGGGLLFSASALRADDDKEGEEPKPVVKAVKVRVIEEGVNADPLNGFAHSMLALLKVFARRQDEATVDRLWSLTEQPFPLC